MDTYEPDEKNKSTEFEFCPVELRTLYIYDINEYGARVMDNIGTAYVRSKNKLTINYIQGETKKEIRLSTKPKDVLFIL